jgi:hypothetical protein
MAIFDLTSFSEEVVQSLLLLLLLLFVIVGIHQLDPIWSFHRTIIPAFDKVFRSRMRQPGQMLKSNLSSTESRLKGM